MLVLLVPVEKESVPDEVKVVWKEPELVPVLTVAVLRGLAVVSGLPESHVTVNSSVRSTPKEMRLTTDGHGHRVAVRLVWKGLKN